MSARNRGLDGPILYVRITRAMDKRLDAIARAARKANPGLAGMTRSELVRQMLVRECNRMQGVP
jgi:hypothetical protein